MSEKKGGQGQFGQCRDCGLVVPCFPLEDGEWTPTWCRRCADKHVAAAVRDSEFDGEPVDWPRVWLIVGWFVLVAVVLALSIKACS